MNLLFDFDGTICDSLDALLMSTNPLMRFLGKTELTKEAIKQKGLIKILAENKIPKVFLPFIVIFVRHRLTALIPILKPFSQIDYVLNHLSTTHTLGIVTSNSKSNVLTFLKNNRLETYFDFVYSSANFLDKSARINNACVMHNLKKTETYFIGDETRDILAAKASNIKTIAVIWGIESEKLLKKTNPDLIVSKPQDLLNHFR